MNNIKQLPLDQVALHAENVPEEFTTQSEKEVWKFYCNRFRGYLTEQHRPGLTQLVQTVIDYKRFKFYMRQCRNNQRTPEDEAELRFWIEVQRDQIELIRAWQRDFGYLDEQAEAKLQQMIEADPNCFGLENRNIRERLISRRRP